MFQKSFNFWHHSFLFTILTSGPQTSLCWFGSLRDSLYIRFNILGRFIGLLIENRFPSDGETIPLYDDEVTLKTKIIAFLCGGYEATTFKKTIIYCFPSSQAVIHFMFLMGFECPSWLVEKFQTPSKFYLYEDEPPF